MRKLLLLLLFTSAIVTAQTDVVKFSGKISNRNSDEITLTGPGIKRAIKVDKDGRFSDSFSAPTGIYEFYDGTEFTELFLKNGLDLQMTMDAKEFDESIIYKGKGEKENNLLARKMLDMEALETKIKAVQTDQQAVMKLLKDFNSDFDQKVVAKGMDPDFKSALDAKSKMEREQQQKQIQAMQEQKAKSAKMDGTVSPGFEYENHKGGKTKLEDFKGKYVYIDTWATWCGPCIAEIPHLKKIEEKYHGKNIEFVSISVDMDKDREKWKKMVSSKNLGGVQLIADKNWTSDFVRAYNINSIPRFILIGPDGKIISADAPRPSSPMLVAELDKLLNSK